MNELKWESYRVINQYNSSKQSPEFRLLNSIFGYTKKEALEILDRDIKKLDEEFLEYPIMFVVYKQKYFEAYRKIIQNKKGKYLYD